MGGRFRSILPSDVRYVVRLRCHDAGRSQPLC